MLQIGDHDLLKSNKLSVPVAKDYSRADTPITQTSSKSGYYEPEGAEGVLNGAQVSYQACVYYII